MRSGFDFVDRLGAMVNASGAAGGWFEPGDEIGRAWDEAEAILLACDDLDSVMEVIRDAESPVDARRALKLGFGFTGRQAALLLTLPVMTFTRSERRRIDENRRDRLEMLADVTGVLPALRAADPEPATDPVTTAEPWPAVDPAPAVDPVFAVDPGPDRGWAPGPDWGTDPDGPFSYTWSAPDVPDEGSSPALEPLPLDSFPQFGAPDHAPTAEPTPAPAPVPEPVAPSRAASAVGPSVRRSTSRSDESSVVLDEQISELCDAIAGLFRVNPPGNAWSDDPRDPTTSAGSLLDSCGVDDATGLRTLLWHLRRTGLDSVEGLFPFAEPLSPGQAFDTQAVRFEQAMSTGSLGSEPGGDARWAGRMWPIAERHGFGYAVSYRSGPGAGVVWAYGGNEPLHRMWDSVVDLLVELYQALTAGEPCDSALAGVVGDRVVWTNLS